MRISMKQTVEEAAREYMKTLPVRAAIKCGDIEDLESHIKVAFKSGAEWQSNQSPWISVKEQLPETDGYFLVTDGEIVAVAYFFECWGKFAKYKEYPHPLYDDGVVKLYMPIPSFDEILEANRDVLKRIKENGD